MLQSNYTDSGEIEFIINKADYDQVRMELLQLKTQYDQMTGNYNQLKDRYTSLQKEYQKAVQDFGNFITSQKQLMESVNTPFQQLSQYKIIEEEINEYKTQIKQLQFKDQQQNELISDLKQKLMESKWLVNDLTQKHESQIMNLKQQIEESEQKNQNLQQQLIELDNRNQETESQKNQILSSHYTRKEENLQLKLQTDNANQIISKLQNERKKLVDLVEEKTNIITQLQKEKSEILARCEQEKQAILSSLNTFKSDYERQQADHERISVENYNQASKIQDYQIQLHKKDEENQVYRDQIIRLSNEKEKASLNELLVQIYHNLVREISSFEQLPIQQRIEERERITCTWNKLFNEYLRKPLVEKDVTFKHEFRDNWVRQ